MDMKTKIWFIAATVFVLMGVILFAAVMTAYNWDFAKLSTVKYETNTYVITEEFSHISINTAAVDISFVSCQDSRVVCFEEVNMKHSVTVEDGKLTIDTIGGKKWYEHIGIAFRNPHITVYIPQGQYGTLFIKSNSGDVEIPKDFKFESIDISGSTGDVRNYASASEGIRINTSTGDICVENISANTVDLSVSTGEVTVSHIVCEGDIKVSVSTGKTDVNHTKCKNLISRGTTGDISLEDVVATGTFSIDRSTGDVRFDDCDAAEIFTRTSTGDVLGSLLTGKVFIAQTDTGRVDIPQTTTGGKCQINTRTGDIKIGISQ